MSGRRHFGSRRRFGRRWTIGRPGVGAKSAGSQRVGSGSSRRLPGSSGRNRRTSRSASALSFVMSPAAASSRKASRSASDVRPVAASKSDRNEAPYEPRAVSTFSAVSLSRSCVSVAASAGAFGASAGDSQRAAVPRSTNRNPLIVRASLRLAALPSPIQTMAPDCVSDVSAPASYGLTRDGR